MSWFGDMMSTLKFWKSSGGNKQFLNEKSNVNVNLNNDAVLVVGGTGKTGYEIVLELLRNNRKVIVTNRNITKTKQLFSDELQNPNLQFLSNIDLNDLKKITPDMFNGVSQVVSVTGPTFGNNSQSSSQDIDYLANAQLIVSMQEAIQKKQSTEVEYNKLASFDSLTFLEKNWTRLDDVVMGGKSSSEWVNVDWNAEGSDFKRWMGNLVVEGGGFCGTLANNISLNTAGYDGISVLVRGDGNRYKFRVRPAQSPTPGEPPVMYQSPFETTPNVWTRVNLPLESFVPVKLNTVRYGAANLGEAIGGVDISSLGLIFSRFDFNEASNPKYSAGKFQLDVKSIELYRNPRPSFVMVSSAGTERINKLTLEECKYDIPIVQLNPQGILHWKYKAETALRKSGLNYSIIRATGLASTPLLPTNTTTASTATSINDAMNLLATPRRLEFHQGDTISGRITRKELAALVGVVLASPYGTNKTFEVRRDETESGKLPSDQMKVNWPKQNLHLNLRSLILDADRSLGSSYKPLLPFPVAGFPPSEPLSKERVAEILNDPRVVSQQTRERSTS
eukprot:gene4040-5781_t